MSNLNVTKRSRPALSWMLWIFAATWIFMALSAGFASAQSIEICHKGKTLTVSVNAALAHLNHGDSPGACGGPVCSCGLNFDPVTCADGKTYANACLAECSGSPGPCTRLGVCSQIYDPVVCNGVTYANRCLALNAGCDPGTITVLCPCPTIYAPVRCGDGKIYVNECVASCSGASGCTPVSE
jgi:hypothetical protein